MSQLRLAKVLVPFVQRYRMLRSLTFNCGAELRNYRPVWKLRLPASVVIQPT